MSEEPAAPFAPGDLEFVRAFVNTLDVEGQTDALQSPAAARAWAAAHDIPVIEEDLLPRAIELREALRDALLANHDRAPLPPRAAALLAETARRVGAVVEFTPRGVALAAPASGDESVLGRVTRLVATALANGTWHRMKACREDTCRWAFYDHSRSRTGKWCSMGVCGNRTKQARWRAANPGASVGAG